MLNPSSLATASFLILAELAAGYIYLHTLYRRPYFMWMALAWGFNAAYVYAEAVLTNSTPHVFRTLLVGVNAFSILAFYLALTDLHEPARRFARYALGGVTGAIGVGVVLLSRSSSMAPWGEPLVLSLIAVLYALPLLGLTQAFAVASTDDLLRALRNKTDYPMADSSSRRSDTARERRHFTISSDSMPITRPDLLRLLNLTRGLMVVSCSVYALLQLSYPLLVFGTNAHYVTILTLFWVAFLTKLVHGAALPLWVLADLKARLEVIGERSMAEELGILAAGVQHDTRNALATLWKELDTMRRKYYHDAPLLARLQRIAEYANRIAAATEVIPIAREIATEFRDRSGPENVVAIARAAAEAVRKVESRGDIIVSVDADRSEIMVHADRPRLTQALIHIINNGIEACRAKNASRPHVTVRCTTSGSQGVVMIVVHDNGIGVSPEIVPRLARPFFTTKAGRNRGMGLFVAARVIRMHSGELSFESDGESYTKVFVTLPRASSAAVRMTSRTD
jgi:signal transduction histidine kinase